MDDAKTYPFKRGQFACKDCQALFYAPPSAAVLEDDHWWASCPGCGGNALETPSMRNLHKTIGTAKGANMSEAGREKTKMNGFTTGSTYLHPWNKATIPMAPAKPDKYPECDDCQDLDECESNVKEKYGTCIPVYCHRKVEVTWKYAAAYLAGDPDMLKLVAADNAAKIQMVLNASFKKIFDRGVECVEDIVKQDKDGGIVHTTQRIYAHPLIKQCVNIMQTMGFALTDWTMTPRSKEAKEQVSGFLAGMAAGSGKNLEEVSGDIRASIDKFRDSLDNAKKMRDQDATLQTFENESGRRNGGQEGDE